MSKQMKADNTKFKTLSLNKLSMTFQKTTIMFIIIHN